MNRRSFLKAIGVGVAASLIPKSVNRVYSFGKHYGSIWVTTHYHHYGEIVNYKLYPENGVYVVPPHSQIFQQEIDGDLWLGDGSLVQNCVVRGETIVPAKSVGHFESCYFESQIILSGTAEWSHSFPKDYQVINPPGTESC